MIQIVKGNLGDRSHPRVERTRNDKPYVYSSHVSPLHTKAVMITGGRNRKAVTLGKQKGHGSMIQLAPRPPRHRARVAKHAGGGRC